MESEVTETPINSCAPFGYYMDVLKGLDFDFIAGTWSDENVESYSDLIAEGKSLQEAVAELQKDNEDLRVTERDRTELEKVEIAALRLFDLEKEASIAEAKKFLKKNPKSIEAKLCLIGWLDDKETQIDQLDEIVGNLPNNELTITQIRAKFELANALNIQRYVDEAMEEYYEILELDEENVFDVGIIITVELANRSKWLDLVKLFERIGGTDNIITSIVRAIAYFYKYGNKAKSVNALRDAYDLDDTPFKILTGAVSKKHEDEEEDLPEDEDVVLGLNILYDVMSRNDKFAKFVVTKSMNWEQGM